MNNTESLEDFYNKKFNWMPDSIRNDIGHFNIFPLDPYVEGISRPLPFKRRDFYKIVLILGSCKFHYADKSEVIKKQGLTFSNPQIPYTYQHLDTIREGVYCIFNHHFFNLFGNLNQYEVFQPNGNHLYELTDEQFAKAQTLFKKMNLEINSDYIHKYDSLRNLVFEIMHLAMKSKPSTKQECYPMNGFQRIAALFFELLERQFPIDENHQKVNLRSASDFANQLNIHVNHLNRAIKETSNKTTSQIIGERILQEAKILLKHSKWNVSEIAYALGFTEVTHFNNFFKKHTLLSPLKYRNG
jgi:AraC family transcriptional regulator, transcriptional activator of pobA